MAISMNECCLCRGRGICRGAFTMKNISGKPDICWIECECGHRSPIMNSCEEAINIWNWMNRENFEDIKKKQTTIQRHKLIEEDNKKFEESKKKQQIISYAKDKENLDIPEKKKRKRRTKAEMMEARKLLADQQNLNKEEKNKSNKKDKSLKDKNVKSKSRSSKKSKK